MATNPPITIGPFANVPAPGSGVKSDWAQQITTYVVGSAWTAVTFQNSWANSGGANQVCQYRKIGDMVHLRGVIKSGTLGAAAFTLPAGFRPPAQLLLPAISNDAAGVLIISAAGVVSPQGASNVYFVVDAQFSVTA